MAQINAASSLMSSNLRDTDVLQAEQLPELPCLDRAVVCNSHLPSEVKYAYLQQLTEIERKSSGLEPVTREDMDNWTAWHDLSASFYRATGTAGILFDTWPPGWQSDFGYVRVDVAELAHSQDRNVAEVESMVKSMMIEDRDNSAGRSLNDDSELGESCAQSEALRQRFEAWKDFGK